MTNRLQGKTAFLSAAGQGIGRATAIAFAQQGARVIATDIDAAALQSLRQETGCETHLLNVMDGAAITALARTVGAIDILFNAAGYVHSGTILDTSEDDWTTAFDLNVRSQFRLIKAFLPGMLERGKGSIINVASVVGSIQQGRRGRADQSGSGRLRHQRHPLQRDLPGHRAVAFAAGAHRGTIAGQWEITGRSRGRLCGTPAHRPARSRGRGGRAGGLPGKRRVVIHHRDCPNC